MQSEEVWKQVIENLRANLPETVIRAWFDDTRIHYIDDQKIVIVTPSELKRDALLKRYQGPISRALYLIFEKNYQIDIIMKDDMPQAPSNDPIEQADNYSFERFVVGPTNELAYAAASSISENPAKGYNPLFIYGGSGLGKTHLLYAVRNRLRERRPDFNVCIFSSEQFTRDLVTAIETGNRAVFHEKYRTADMLIVDDIQFIATKEFVQEEFFHTFNTLHEAGKQIVMTSDRAPKEMKKLEDRLRSRFEWGLVVDIQPPDIETRIAILRSKAMGIGLPLPEQVSTHIAQNITQNVRQLEGIIKKLMAYHDLMGFSISIDTATRAIGDLMKELPGLNPTPDLIIERVCDFYDVNVNDVMSSSRRAKLVQARQISMFLIREITGKSFQEIAEMLNRDHSTVMHSIEKVADQRAEDTNLQNDLKLITENIRSD